MPDQAVHLLKSSVLLTKLGLTITVACAGRQAQKHDPNAGFHSHVWDDMLLAYLAFARLATDAMDEIADGDRHVLVDLSINPREALKSGRLSTLDVSGLADDLWKRHKHHIIKTLRRVSS